jgi:hypothetical protein
VIAVVFFFLVPAFYWFSEPSAIVYYDTSLYVYRSLGCATIGIGTTYYPANTPGNYSGLQIGCKMVLPEYPIA